MTDEERQRIREALARTAAEAAEKRAAYEAYLAATETPEQRAERRANAARCAEWDAKNTM